MFVYIYIFTCDDVTMINDECDLKNDIGEFEDMILILSLLLLLYVVC